jgi:uncharacterized protein (TIGR02466 family)
MNYYKTDLFKQSIFSFKLDLDLNIINNYCLEYEKNNHGRVLSNSGGFQSNDLDFNVPIINKLCSLILSNVNYVSTNYFKFTQSLYITNIWFNINRYKDNNDKHLHPNSLFSGVFYSKIPDNSGHIKFFNSESATIFLADVDLTEFTKYNSSSFRLKPEVSFLHIFPSFLNHCVEPNLSQTEERISFSFNVNRVRN